jgi:hypothetical protein
MIHYNTIQVPPTCIHKTHENANPCPREPARTTFTPGRAHRSNTYIGKQLSEEGSPSSTTPPPRSENHPITIPQRRNELGRHPHHRPRRGMHAGRVLMQVIPLDQAHTRCRSDRACRQRREAVGLMGVAERAERAETVGEEVWSGTTHKPTLLHPPRR